MRPRGRTTGRRTVSSGGQGVALGLTVKQTRQVIAAASARGESAGLLAALSRPGELSSSPLMEDHTLSRSLLLGLVVLIAFPANGGERGIKEVARELVLPISTTYRYVHTLHAVGLLERNPRSRRYRRSHELG